MMKKQEAILIWITWLISALISVSIWLSVVSYTVRTTHFSSRVTLIPLSKDIQKKASEGPFKVTRMEQEFSY